MNLPEHMSLEIERSDGRYAYGTLTFDVTGWMQTLGKATKAAVTSFNNVARVLREHANDEVRVCGLEAQYYVRGSHAEDIDSLVLTLLTTYRGDLLALTRASRSRLAAAAIRGHVDHQDGTPASSFSWHRSLSGVYVSVGRE